MTSKCATHLKSFSSLVVLHHSSHICISGNNSASAVHFQCSWRRQAGWSWDVLCSDSLSESAAKLHPECCTVMELFCAKESHCQTATSVNLTLSVGKLSSGQFNQWINLSWLFLHRCLWDFMSNRISPPVNKKRGIVMFSKQLAELLQTFEEIGKLPSLDWAISTMFIRESLTCCNFTACNCPNTDFFNPRNLQQRTQNTSVFQKFANVCSSFDSRKQKASHCPFAAVSESH